MKKFYIINKIGVTGLGKKIYKAGESVTEDNFPEGRFEKLLKEGWLRKPTNKEEAIAIEVYEDAVAEGKEETKRRAKLAEEAKKKDKDRAKAKEEEAKVKEEEAKAKEEEAKVKEEEAKVKEEEAKVKEEAEAKVKEEAEAKVNKKPKTKK